MQERSKDPEGIDDAPSSRVVNESGQRGSVLGLSRAQGSRQDVTTPFTPDTADGFGARLLMLDAEGVPTWEALRLRKDFASIPGVREALHRRLDQLAGFDHPSFPAVRVVEEHGEPGRDLLLSAYMPGRRLSELKRPRSAAFAMVLIRDLTLSLAALQGRGEDVTHGSLTMDRILVTPDGRLIVRDHVLGAVLDKLALPATQMWSDLGVLQPAGRQVAGRQLDAIHVALVALSSILGRSIGRGDYPDRVMDLVNQQVLFPPLRRWLNAAFDLDGAGLSSAESAQDAMVRHFPSPSPGEAEVRASLAVFAGKAAEPPRSPAGRLGFRRFWRDEGGTAFRPVDTGDVVGGDQRSRHE